MTNTETKNKQWFKMAEPLKTKDIVEYSTDINFFLENQIRIVRSGIRHVFCSKLEARTFKEERAFNNEGTFEDYELTHKARLIHAEILEGKHGEGEFVN